MEHDPLARVLCAIKNAEQRGKSELSIKPSSKVIARVLEILKHEGYIADFELIDDNRGGILHIKLAGKINKIGVIKPRFSVGLDEYAKFEERYLPAKNFGKIIVSTPAGIMTHVEAKEKRLGGVLLAYVY